MKNKITLISLIFLSAVFIALTFLFSYGSPRQWSDGFYKYDTFYITLSSIAPFATYAISVILIAVLLCKYENIFFSLIALFFGAALNYLGFAFNIFKNLYGNNQIDIDPVFIIFDLIIKLIVIMVPALVIYGIMNIYRHIKDKKDSNVKAEDLG